LSLSVGLVEINGLLTIDELLSRADTAMYQAKGQGGNSIVVAPHDGA
jgi:PleD family two-component response regulator